MGKEISQGTYTREERATYRYKVRRCLDVFALMLDDFAFDADHPMTGLEIELNLMDAVHEPAMRNAEVLAEMNDPGLPDRAGPVQPRAERAAAADREQRARRLQRLHQRKPGPGQPVTRPSSTPRSS